MEWGLEAGNGVTNGNGNENESDSKRWASQLSSENTMTQETHWKSKAKQSRARAKHRITIAHEDAVNLIKSHKTHLIFFSLPHFNRNRYFWFRCFHSHQMAHMCAAHSEGKAMKRNKMTQYFNNPEHALPQPDYTQPTTQQSHFHLTMCRSIHSIY